MDFSILFKKIISHCAGKVQPIWQVTTMKCIAWLLLFTRTQWIEILSEGWLQFLWTCFSRLFLNFYSKQNKCFINISWNWRCLKISKPIEKRCQTIVKKLSSKSLGGDIGRYRSHREKRVILKPAWSKKLQFSSCILPCKFVNS